MKGFLYMVVGLFNCCSGMVNYTEQVQNYVGLISLYTVNNISTIDFIPLSDLTSPINVTVDMTMLALNDFDEIAGNVELAGVLEMSWRDEIALANTASDFTGFIYSAEKTSFLVPHNKIWTPKLVLANSVDSISAIGDSAYMCRFHMETYLVEWSPRMLTRAACSPDVTFYPFDRQSCVMTFVPWGYTHNEILLSNNKSSWDLSSYEDNGEWKIVVTKTETFVSGTTSSLRLSLTIERKPLYFAFNIILPILVLCILNSMVFWLPAASGERVGFSVTCFLSFVVLLNLVFEILPRSSSPISYLCYYLVVMMVFSGLVSGFVIIEMNAFHKSVDDKMPEWLQKFIQTFTCHWCCKCRRNTVSDGRSQQNSERTGEDMTKNVPREGSPQTNGNSYDVANVMKRKQSYPVEKQGDIVNDGHLEDLDGDLTEDQSNSVEHGLKTTISGNSCSKHVDEETAYTKDVRPSEHEVTWIMLGGFLDKVFFVAFLGGQIFFSVTFLLPLGFRAMT